MSVLRRLAAPAVGLALLLTGCSTVPTSSPTIEITQVAAPTDTGVGVEPLSPEPGATPEEVVRGFIEASASVVRNHPVARQYLAADAAKWSDSDGVTVLSEDYAAVQTQAGTVVVTGTVVGTVDEHGVFEVGGGTVYNQAFTLTDDSGEWRISDPPDGLLLLEPDFARTYDAVDAYFLDPTGARVVPDPRYLVGGEAQPNTLVERLVDGASPSIAAGVTDPLSVATLRSTVSVSGTTATVDLTWPPDVTDATLAAASAQLVWSLEQPELGLQTVVVLRDGQPLGLPGIPDRQSTDDWASLDPDAAPAGAVGHYIDAGGLRLATDGTAAPGPAGTGVYALASAAVSVDPSTAQLGLTVGVSTAPSPSGDAATLLAGTYGGELAPVLTGDSFTDPTTAGTRTEIWTVRNGDEVVRLPSGGSPQAVSATTLAGLGRVTQFQLSPDGVRAAVVVQGAEGGQLFVGTVVRDSDAVSVRDLRSVTPTVEQVVDVAWRNAGQLMLLGSDPGSGRTVPYTAGVDGWDLQMTNRSGLPGVPTALAAAPQRLPLVSANGQMWQLAGGTWVTLVRGSEAQPGTAPFYPM